MARTLVQDLSHVQGIEAARSPLSSTDWTLTLKQLHLSVANKTIITDKVVEIKV